MCLQASSMIKAYRISSYTIRHFLLSSRCLVIDSSYFITHHPSLRLFNPGQTLLCSNLKSLQFFPPGCMPLYTFSDLIICHHSSATLTLFYFNLNVPGSYIITPHLFWALSYLIVIFFGISGFILRNSYCMFVVISTWKVATSINIRSEALEASLDIFIVNVDFHFAGSMQAV